MVQKNFHQENLRGRIHPVWSIALLALAALAAGQSASAQTRKIEVSDFAKIVSVSDPQISPDGRSIAVVVSRPNLKDNRSDVELVLVDVATGEARPLTFKRRGVGSPRWSPSGDRLAFLASAGTGKDAHEQIFVLPMDGGDVRQITHAADDVEQFAWRPDGKDFAYVVGDEPPNKKEIEAHHDLFEVGNQSFLSTEADMPSHIWLISAGGGEAKRLTSGTWSLPKSGPPSPPSSPLSWSPDGSQISFTMQASPYAGDSDVSAVQILNVASGKFRKLTAHEKFEAYGTYAPDGSNMFYFYNRDGDPNSENEVFVTAPAGGEGKDITRALDRDVARATWMPDGRSLLVGSHDGTRVSLWLQPLDGRARKLDLGVADPSWSYWVDFNVGPHGEIAFTASDPGRPRELYFMSSANAKPRRLTDYNAEIAALHLGKMEKFEWKGPDGFTEDGTLTFPPDFTAGTKYPLVLIIHGGPTSASTESFAILNQLMAAQGFIVFSPNYRGSDNLGNTYQHAIFNDAGDGPGRDVIAGIEALKKRGFIDETRIGVSGWSYGGYMTSWLLGHSTMWKAAVSGAAVNDLAQEETLSDFNINDRYIMACGSPWVGDCMKSYVEQSPITYASRIKAPTLILCDTGDFRVPITESYAMFHALKDNGTPVKFVAIPVGGHFPGDPIHAMDTFSLWVGWMAEHLK